MILDALILGIFGGIFLALIVFCVAVMIWGSPDPRNSMELCTHNYRFSHQETEPITGGTAQYLYDVVI